MGYLAYGAMAGAAGEYVKQSDEKRERGYQMIRDKRIAGLRRENDEYAHNLDVTENTRQEGVAAGVLSSTQAYESAEAEKTRKEDAKQKRLDRTAESEKPFNTPAGTQSGQIIDGQYEKLHAQASESSQPGSAGYLAHQKWMDESVELVNGKRESLGDLRKVWADIAYQPMDNPEFPGLGLKITGRDPSVPDFPLWLNAQVVEKDRLMVNDPKYMQGDAARLWKYAQGLPEFKQPGGRQNAIDAIKAANPWWPGPKEATSAVNPGTEGPDLGAGPDPKPIVNNENEGPNADAVPVLNSGGASTSAGMLSQANMGPPTGTITINAERIAVIEAKLKAMEGKTGRVVQDRPALEKELKKLKDIAKAG